MTIKEEGIIFRSFKYSETSLIVDIFTREQGILSFIISGVRKKKSRISAAMLQVMNIVDIIGFSKNSNSLGRLTEIKNSYVHKELLYDFIKSSVGIFIIELSRNCIKEKESNIEIYDFMKHFLIFLDETEMRLGLFPILYMIQFSKFLGFYPNNNYTKHLTMFDWKEACFVAPENQNQFCMEPSASSFLSQLLSCNSLEELNTYTISKSERKAIMESLLYFYQYHIESFKPLKSYKVLEEMMRG